MGSSTDHGGDRVFDSTPRGVDMCISYITIHHLHSAKYAAEAWFEPVL